MVGFPYGAARGLGGMQIFLGLAAMGLGIGDVVIGVSTNRAIGYWFRFYMLGTGIWTGLFFLIAGSLAASISEGRMVGCKIGAAQTMSLLNAVVFAPGLDTVAAISAIQQRYSYGYWWSYEYYSFWSTFHLLFALEVALAVVGGLEFIFSIATASVCCCGDPYEQLATNQAGPMAMVAYPTIIQQPIGPATMKPYGYAQSSGTPWNMGGTSIPVIPPITAGADGQMGTLPAAELGVQYA